MFLPDPLQCSTDIMCESVKARVWSCGVVVGSPVFDDLPGMAVAGEQVFVETLITETPVKLSTKPFCMGLPGAM